MPHRRFLALSAVSVLAALPNALLSQGTTQRSPDPESLPFAPRHYVCYRTPSPLIIDGTLDEVAWRQAPWTDPFVDIEGDARPRPRFRTRAKMLWDADSFYVAAELEEADVWGALTERDSIVYNDNDFEVFIDPDGDTQLYYELEVNALKTVFDLMLERPYRDGGRPIIAWDIAGLRVGANVNGTLNQPGDKDRGWTVEIAMPWNVLREAARGRRPPRPGEQWRVNFSRVEWKPDVKEGHYTRRVDPATGKPPSADNWVWSPQGAIDMHMPERWGYVQFSASAAGAGTDAFVEDPNERVKWALRRLYYRQRRFRAANGHYAEDLNALKATDLKVEGTGFSPVMQAGADWYRITVKGDSGAVVHIQQDGRVWVD